MGKNLKQKPNQTEKTQIIYIEMNKKHAHKRNGNAIHTALHTLHKQTNKQSNRQKNGKKQRQNER